jgi:Kef-type K+ transport system membrane component KefB
MPNLDFMSRKFLFLLALMAGPGISFASGEGHGDPFAGVFQAFAIILVSALIGRFIVNKLKQSVVLGELVIGIILGSVLMGLNRPSVHLVRNLDVVQEITSKVENGNISIAAAVDETLAPSTLPETEKQNLKEILTSGKVTTYTSLVHYIQLFSTIGIALLLFMVGLEGSIRDLIKLGSQGVVIALLGIMVTFGLGYTVLELMLPSTADPRLAFFGAATICSTSAGITARVLKDMDKLSSPEAKVTMGAAVFDDIFGLIILAVLASVMGEAAVDMVEIGGILLKIVLFLLLVVVFGLIVLPRITPYVEKLDPKSTRLLFPFILLLVFCYLANAFGLAMIIGAYFAGLMIKDDMFTKASEGEYHDTIHSLMSPIEGIFVPVFFVLMGIQVDISLFADGQVLLMGLALSAVAVTGKIVAVIFLPKGINKLAVGFGMVPRGEVVLIFASIGKSMGIINSQFYAVTVLVILATVLITPFALNMAFSRNMAGKL